jgi:hypothetical protein
MKDFLVEIPGSLTAEEEAGLFDAGIAVIDRLFDQTPVDVVRVKVQATDPGDASRRVADALDRGDPPDGFRAIGKVWPPADS